MSLEEIRIEKTISVNIDDFRSRIKREPKSEEELVFFLELLISYEFDDSSWDSDYWINELEELLPVSDAMNGRDWFLNGRDWFAFENDIDKLKYYGPCLKGYRMLEHYGSNAENTKEALRRVTAKLNSPEFRDIMDPIKKQVN